MSSKTWCGSAALALTLSLAVPARAQDADVAAAPAIPSAAAVAAGQAPTQPAAGNVVVAQTTDAPAAAAPRGAGIPIDVSGYFWTDGGYLQRRNDMAGDFDQNSAYMTGHFALGGTYRQQVGRLAAEATLVGVGILNEYGSSNAEVRPILDAFVKVGQERWDVQVGRFLGWEVYQRGQGIELYTAEEAGALGSPRLYLLDFTRGRLNGPGQAAVHVYPSRFAGIELMGVFGSERDSNWTGVRPVVDLHVGDLQLIGGYEYLKVLGQKSNDKAEQTKSGWAARLQYRLGLATAGVDWARSDVELVDPNEILDTKASGNTTSLGGYVDLDFWKNSIGLGYHRTTLDNLRGESPYQDQAFVSYLYRLPVDGLSVKAVYGWATGYLETIDAGGSAWENHLQSFRLRVAYEFK